MGRSCLIDPKDSAVIDASTAINLNATGHAARILRALPNRVSITDVAAGELKKCRVSGRPDDELLAHLVSSGLIAIVPLSEVQERHFESLVIGPGADTLDDGEAATIAYALESGAVATFDERKAARICATRYPHLKVGCTVDLLAHDAVEKAIGADTLANAVFSALQDARMRVSPHHMDWVTGLIGPERALKCPSLPRAVRTPTKNTGPAPLRWRGSQGMPRQ